MDTSPQSKERPILFSAPMVRAILDGRKTVTRRPVKGLGLQWLNEFTPEYVADSANSLCPFGQPGDRLWVREAWARIRVAQAPDQEWVVYRESDNRTDYGGPWKPGIHMFRRDSRILLEITDVRVERLQDISEGQAVDEGLVWEGVKGGKTYWNHVDHRYPPGTHQRFSVSGTDAVSAFRNLWKSAGGDWDANPWVWVVEFKRVAP